MSIFRPKTLLTLSAAAIVSFSGAAFAQVDHTPESDFLEGLSRRGLNPLIKHYVETKAIGDPVVKLRAEIAAAKGTIFNNETQPAARNEAIAAMNKAYRELYEKARRDPEMPGWTVDQARTLIDRLLPLYNFAAQFAEFGLPTADQEEKFNTLTAESYFALDAGALAWFDIQVRAPRSKNFNDMVNDGTWSRMRTTGNIMIPYYRAQAAYYSSFQGENDAFFKRKSELAKLQGYTVDFEKTKKETLGQALADVENVWELGGGQFDPRTRSEVLALKGRILSRMGKHEDGIKHLNDAIRTGRGAINSYGANTPAGQYMNTLVFFMEVAKATAIGNSGQKSQASGMLSELRGHSLVKANPNASIIYLLLLADAESRLYKGDRVKAFEPYRKLLADTSIPAQTREVLKQLIYSRVYKTLDATQMDFAKEPIFIVEAVARQSMAEGNAVIQAKGPAEEANKHLLISEKAHTALLNERKTDVDPKQLPGIAYNYAATLWSLRKQVDAAKAMLNVADEYPDSEVAVPSLSFVYNVIGQLYSQNPDNPEAIKLYERVLTLLTGKFNDEEKLAQLVRNAEYEFASYLFNQKRYDEAVKAYDKIGKGHPFELAAVYEQLIAYYSLWEDAEPDKRVAYIPPINEKSEYYEKIASRAVQSGGLGEADRQRVQERRADTMLVMASMRADNPTSAKEALEQLDKFAKEFGDIASMKNRALIIRIRALVASGQLDQVTLYTSRLQQNDPTNAGAIIMNVIKSVNGEIDQLKLVGKHQDAKKLAKVSKELASQLLDWFRKNYPESDPLPIIILSSQADVAAGAYEDAISALEKLSKEEKYKNNVDVLSNLAEAYYGAGRFSEAAKIYTFIMNNAKDETSDLYWNAVVRVYQISDKQTEIRQGDEANPKIHLGAKRMISQNPAMPGKYKAELDRLMKKHTPR